MDDIVKYMDELARLLKLIGLKQDGKIEEAIKYIMDETNCDEDTAKAVFEIKTKGLGEVHEPCISKCPTCGSIDIERIIPLEQGVSIYLVGMLGNEFNKTFKCNNCGYTW